MASILWAELWQLENRGIFQNGGAKPERDGYFPLSQPIHSQWMDRSR